jgi:type II secretory pathway component PulC
MANRLLLSALSQKSPAGAGAVGIHQWLAPLATAVALGIAAWIGTEWFWYFKGGQRHAAPTVAAAAPAPDARMLSESLAASSLFGTARTIVVAQSTANVKLKGIIASGPNGVSAAIVNTGSRDEVVEVGKDLGPGLILQAVYPTHVLIQRGGLIERIDMIEAKGGGGGQLGLAATRRVPGGLPSPVVQPVPGMTPGMPPGVPQPQGRAKRMERDAGVATGRLNMTSAGPTVEDAPPGSLLSRIGLQQGDVIKSIGGLPVQPGRDMVRLFRMGTSGEVVQGEVLRGGQLVPMQIGLQK